MPPAPLAVRLRLPVRLRASTLRRVCAAVKRDAPAADKAGNLKRNSSNTCNDVSRCAGDQLFEGCIEGVLSLLLLKAPPRVCVARSLLDALPPGVAACCTTPQRCAQQAVPPQGVVLVSLALPVVGCCCSERQHRPKHRLQVNRQRWRLSHRASHLNT